MQQKRRLRHHSRARWRHCRSGLCCSAQILAAGTALTSAADTYCLDYHFELSIDLTLWRHAGHRSCVVTSAEHRPPALRRPYAPAPLTPVVHAQNIAVCRRVRYPLTRITVSVGTGGAHCYFDLDGTGGWGILAWGGTRQVAAGDIADRAVSRRRVAKYRQSISL